MKADTLALGVFGSCRTKTMSPDSIQWTKEFVGLAIKSKITFVSGGAGGISKTVRDVCSKKNGTHISILPNKNFSDKINNNNFEINTNVGVVGRMSILTQSIDIGIAISGGVGTLIEVAMCYLQKIPVIVIDGLQRKNDPKFKKLCTKTVQEEICGVQVLKGWLDSKPEDNVMPIRIIEKSIAFEKVLEIICEINNC